MLIALIVVVVGLALYLMTAYNGLVRLKGAVRQRLV